MAYIVRIYCDNNIFSIDLSNYDSVTIGGDNSDTLCIQSANLSKNQILIQKKGEQYIIKGKRLYDHGGTPIIRDCLAEGNRYTISSIRDIHLSIHPKQNDSDQKVGLLDINKIYIGRNKNNDIVLSDKRTSGQHCLIKRTNGVLRIQDLGSTNGTYVNEKKIGERVLCDGDVINISIYQMVVQNNALLFYNVGDDMSLNLRPLENSICDQGTDDKDSGTISVFKVQEKISINENKSNGTVSAFDININIEHK